MTDKSKFFSFTPQNEFLKKYIAYYYFHYSDDENSLVEFDFYPNYLHAITVYYGSKSTITDDQSIVKPVGENILATPFYNVNAHYKLGVSILGKFSKIGIVFNPLGIYYFFRNNFENTGNKKFNIFPIDQDLSFLKLLEDVAIQDHLEDKVQSLDQWFSQNFKELNQSVLTKSLEILFESNGSIKVEELANQLDINRKALFRLYKKYLFTSVEDYKKLIMFRNALNYCKNLDNDINLTDVALYSMYYDQAHFIKHFKSITNHTPKTLMQMISPIGTQNTLWKFKK